MSRHEKIKGTSYGAKTSKLYNESAYLLSLETIPAILSNPPKDFEKIIKEFYKRKHAAIIKRTQAYLSEDKTEMEISSSELFIQDPSNGLKKALEKLMPKLKTALEENNK